MVNSIIICKRNWLSVPYFYASLISVRVFDIIQLLPTVNLRKEPCRMTTSEWSDIFAKIKKLSDADKERLLIFLHALKGNEDSSTPPAADLPVNQEAAQ